MAYVYLCTEEQEQPVRIAKLFAPFRYDNETRCDLHPRWNTNGNKVCIDSVHGGKRAIYTIPISKKFYPPIPKPVEKLSTRKEKDSLCDNKL